MSYREGCDSVHEERKASDGRKVEKQKSQKERDITGLKSHGTCFSAS